MDVLSLPAKKVDHAAVAAAAATATATAPAAVAGAQQPDSGQSEHSGTIEMEAVKLSLLRITRKQRYHGHRGALLVDARAVGSTLMKGRTSARTLRRGCLGVAAIS